MPICYSVTNGLFHINVTGMSKDFKEEFFKFRREKLGTRNGIEGSETTVDDFAPKGEVQEPSYYYEGYFNQSSAKKVADWLKEKGAVSAVKVRE